MQAVLRAFLIAAFFAVPTVVRSADKESSAKDNVRLSVTDWKGVQKLVGQNKGKVVVIDIWTTTCPGCLTKFPKFVALGKAHPKAVALISVNCDYDGVKDKPPKHYRPDVMKFLKKQNATFTNVMLDISFIDFLEKVKLESTPAVFVYDKTGKLAKRFDNDNATKVADEYTMKQVAALVKKLAKARAAK